MEIFESYHEEWGNDPINNNTERNLNPYLTAFENMMQALKANFAENRVHHYKQANSCESELAY